MMDMLQLFAYGPPGGINAQPALFWVSVWTLILGGVLYASLYFPQWVPMDDEH